MTGRSTRPGLLHALLVSLLVLLVGCSGGSKATSTLAGTATTSWAFDAKPPSDWSGDTVAVATLPTQARATLSLVEAGGPYPFRQDDGVFGNREGVLPDRPDGTYREYTVVTPGSSDRGARRLIIAGGRALYYTDDHYVTFRFVTP